MADAALIEVSIMGTGIVAPDRWEAQVGRRVEVFWEGMSGTVFIRRTCPYLGATNFVFYGVEYADNPSVLGKAIFERLVLGSGGEPTWSPLS